MLIEQTLDKLATLRLKGMVEAFRQWARSPSRSETAPEDLLGMLADAEWTSRENRKLTRRLQGARFREPACIEDIDYAHPRGLKKATIMDLASSRWIADHRCVIITGLTGVGKTYLACALGNKACRDGYGTLYFRQGIRPKWIAAPYHPDRSGVCRRSDRVTCSGVSTA